MDKHITIKRIWSLFLAIVLIMGTVTVSAPKMAKAADKEITVAYNSRWDDGTGAYVWEFDIENLPGDAPATVYYRLETMTVDGTEQTNQVWVDVKSTGKAYIWAANWDGAKPTSSLLIKKGAILRKANQENPWVSDPDGETLKISNDVYVTSTDGGTTWEATEYKENTEKEITVAYNSRWDDGTGAYVWEFDIENLPGDAPATVYYRLETMTVDGTEQTNQVWVDVKSTGKAYIWAANWDGAKPTSSLLIKKGAILRKANQENPWVSDPDGETLKISNDVYVTSTDGGTTWEATEYTETPTPPTVTPYEVAATISTSSGVRQLWLSTNPDVYTYYGDWSVATSKVLIDGVETTMQWNITQLGMYIDLPENYTTVTVPEGTEFTVVLNTAGNNDKTPFIITNKIEWSKEASQVTTDVKLQSHEMWPNKKENFCQVIFHTDVDLNTLYPWGVLKGNITIDGKDKEVNWNIIEGLIYTLDITYDEYAKAESIAVKKDSIFTLSTDADKMVRIEKGYELKKIGGAWLDESQTKAKYNNVKISLSSSDGRGFYLNAEIIAGPDKGKNIGGKDAYGDWGTSAIGVITYNGNQTMEVYFSTAGTMLYISGDYNLSKMTQIEFKAGTVLLPMEGAKCNTMLRLANDLKLAKDTRYNRWVLAGQENKEYQFNDVNLEVTRITGSVLEMRGTFKNQPNKKLKDVYGDWVLLNGAITLGDPSTGTRTDDDAVWSLAGDLLMLYGVKAGMMDFIRIPSGTILWPDSSCKSENPIRIANDVVLTRNTEDEWVILSGKPSASTGGTQSNENSSVESEKNETAKKELNKDGTYVRLVDANNKKSDADKIIPVSNNHLVYIAVGITSVLLVSLIVGCLVAAKKRKKGE